MATADDFKNVRTMEQVSTLLSFLYQNIAAIEKVHYDLYLNPTAMYVEVERYDSEGKLTTESIPNLAQMREITYSGAGEPNGVQSAAVGSIYIDTLTANIYYKSTNSDRFGWVLLRSTKNFVAAVDYLTPDGDGSLLTALNAGNIASGTLPVVRGGSGVSTITGILKGNGINPYSVAEDGVDFMGPDTFIGVISFYPITTIPSGWLRCDGASYSKETYDKLYAIIGDTYNNGSEEEGYFSIPDLRNYFIRCWDGTSALNKVQAAQVGTHNHALGGTTIGTSPHSHTRGTMNITGRFNGPEYWQDVAEGAFYYTGQRGLGTSRSDRDNLTFSFDASRSWTGSTSAESSHYHTLPEATSKNATAADGSDLENRVVNKMLVPMIKY